MSKSVDLHGLLTAAMDDHIVIVDSNKSGPTNVTFTLDTDVTVRPPFERDNLLGLEWSGTTETRSYMLLSMPKEAYVKFTTPEGRDLKGGEVWPYQLFSAEPVMIEGDDHILYSFQGCEYFIGQNTKVTKLSAYDLFALVAAQDARDNDVIDTLRSAVIDNNGTCGLSVEDREDLLRHLLGKKSGYTRRKSRNVRTTRQVALIDPLTNAITETGKGAITPADYFTEEGRAIDTGAGGVVMLDIRASDDADIEDMSTYVSDDRTRFWLDHLYPLVLDAPGDSYEVHGSELLAHAGYRNPYDKKHEPVMRDAAKNIDKALKTRVGIDVTNEKRNSRRRNRNLIESIELRPIVDGIMTLDRYDEDGDEVRDFTVTVKPRVGEDVIDALPLAKYAQHRGMLTNYTQEEITFSGVRQTLDDRRMWAYVLRRIKSKKMSGTIKLDTMWNDLKIDDGLTKNASRKKRSRMLGKLEKMLEEKNGELFASWTWRKDADGRVVGVQIRRKKN